MKFKVSKEIFEKFPDVVEYVIVGTGLNIEVSSKEINDMLDGAAKELKGNKSLLANPKYSKWIDVYNSIREGFVPSHVALAKRAIDEKRVPHINPIVNLYNYYSLKYGIPFGGEDLGKVFGDMELKIAKGDELFLGMGDSRVEKITKGEVIWEDDHSVTCRMWAWRQSERTKLTKNSKDVYFIIDSFSEFEVGDVIENFVEDLKKYFGGEFQIIKLSSSGNELSVQYKTNMMKNDCDTNKDLEQLIDTSKNQKKGSAKSLLQRRSKSLELVDSVHMSQKISKVVDDLLVENGINEKSQLSVSSNLKFGDYSSTVALRLAQSQGKPVNEVSKALLQVLNEGERLKETFSRIEKANNGFINFTMSEKYLVDELRKAVGVKDKYGYSDIGKNRKFVVESPSINPNAPAHIGHLRNLLIGRSLARLLESVGFEVEKDNLINDKDNKVCMAMWGYQKFGKGKTPETEGMKPDHFVGDYYVIGRQAYNSDPKAKKEVDEMLRKLENNHEDTTKLWMKVTKWAFDGQLETFERLNEDRGYLWFESELWKGGKSLIEKYIGKGVVERLTDGAVVGRIEEKYGVPDVVLLRSDGTSLYHTQDLNLTLQKIKKYGPWKAIWVVGNEHILHFQRLFALLDAIGVLKIDNLYAYVYGMVVGKDGKKISSRSGEDANSDQLLDMACEAAMKVLKSRDIDEEKKEKIAEKVGQGAIRFEILSKDAYKDIILDIDKAVSFTGKSGSYVMYAYTRAKSILRKIEDSDNKSRGGEFEIGDIERSLLLKLLNFPEVVLSAANNYSLSMISEYSYEVANLFNNFYEKCPVSDAPDDKKSLRKAVTELSANVLKSSLGILGIQVIEEM
ncbi:MAG: arginine--tRNA ligase [bacterium]